MLPHLSHAKKLFNGVVGDFRAAPGNPFDGRRLFLSEDAGKPLGAGYCGQDDPFGRGIFCCCACAALFSCSRGGLCVVEKGLGAEGAGKRGGWAQTMQEREAASK